MRMAERLRRLCWPACRRHAVRCDRSSSDHPATTLRRNPIDCTMPPGRSRIDTRLQHDTLIARSNLDPGDRTMLNRLTSIIIAFVLVALAVSPAWADEYSDTIAIFKNAGESGAFFNTAYGYAVFPTIVKG